MRRIRLLLLVLVPAFATPVVAQAARPPASGRVVGATVAVSGVPAPAPERARAAAVVAPAKPAAAQAASAADAPIAHAAAGATVAIRDFSFGPAAITVHVGDTVTWSNAGPTLHTATANDGAFDTGTLKAGQSGSHTFTSAGTFAYHCTIHPFMRGTVQVIAAATGGSGGGAAAAPAGRAAPPTQAAAAPPTQAAAAPHGPTLPNTGMSAPGLAGLGALMLLCGVILRARTRPR